MSNGIDRHDTGSSPPDIIPGMVARINIRETLRSVRMWAEWREPDSTLPDVSTNDSASQEAPESR